MKTKAFILFLIIVNIITLAFYFDARSHANSLKPEAHTSTLSDVTNSENLLFLAPRTAYIPEKDMLVNFSPLKVEFTEILDSESNADVSIYFEYLNSGSNFSINGTTRHTPASLVKVPIAMRALKQVEEGQLTLEKKLIITDDLKSSSWGALYMRPSGTEITVSELLQELLINSDSTAKNLLSTQFGAEEIQSIIDSAGVDELFDEDGKVTVKEYSRVFRALYTSSYLMPKNSEYILELLSQAPRDTYLPISLPNDVSVAHKFGADKINGYYNDSAIVYLEGRPYLLIVLVQSKDENVFSEEAARQLMSVLSKAAYDYVEGL